jgi:hypothetical protein
MEHWKSMVAGGVVATLGIAVGATLFGSHPAGAQDAQFRECIIARQESLDTGHDGHVARPDVAHTILVPPGYVPVGGGGFLGGQYANPTAAVVLCRR